MSPQENLIKKIQKLMALKEGAEALGNMAEASNAAAKISDILMKYNLDMAQVNTTSLQDTISQEKVHSNDFYKKSEGDWIVMLAHKVAKANLCKSIKSNKFNGCYDLLLVGEKQNLEVVRWLLDYLITSGRRICRKDFAKYQGMGGPQKWGKYRRSWLNGFAIAIAKRMEENVVKQVEENPGVPGLIRVMDNKITEYCEKHFNLNKGKAFKQNKNHGFGFGVQAGQNISLSKAIDLGTQGNSRMLN